MSPLLSIAMPTYNRAQILDEALHIIIPQIRVYDNIELIISDNYSTDHTKDIIQKWESEYPKLIKTFFQSENTGFYGNFRKCKELAQGKYIWLLSDDDHLNNTALKTIMNCLEDVNPDILHLKNKIKSNTIRAYSCSFDQLVLKENYRLTLISASIFKNNHSNDTLIFNKFNRSAFLGFALLMSTLPSVKKVVVINNKLFSERKAKPGGYNFYKVFVLQIQQIFDFMSATGHSQKSITAIKKNILYKLILKRYIYQKVLGHLDGTLETYNFTLINKMLFKYYKQLFCYWLVFIPLRLLPNFYYAFRSIKPFKIRD